jgi:hypothetical protein
MKFETIQLKVCDFPTIAHGRWFSPGTATSSTTKIGRHDIAEILLKVALKYKKSNKNIKKHLCYRYML